MPYHPEAREKLDELFKAYVLRPDMEWDMAEGALLVATQEHPSLDREKYLAMVRDLIAQTKTRLKPLSTKQEKIEALNELFFQQNGFHGDVDDYYDPRNSYLSDVLERKQGIPISLSILYLLMAWGADCPLLGINFPGHFLVEWREAPLEFHKSIYVDVFNKGKILTVEDLQALLNKNSGSEQKLEPVFHLQAAGVRGILHRMLGNLKAIHAAQGLVDRALWAAEWMILLKSNDWNSLRDKGLFLFSMGEYDESEKCLEEYLDKTKKPVDFAQVWQVLYAMRSRDTINLN